MQAEAKLVVEVFNEHTRQDMGRTQTNETATTPASTPTPTITLTGPHHRQTNSCKGITAAPLLPFKHGERLRRRRHHHQPPTTMTTCPIRTHLEVFQFGGTGTSRCVKRLMTLPARSRTAGFFEDSAHPVRFAKDKNKGGESGK